MNRIGEAECHVVNEDNVMELNLVDIAGKSTATSTEGVREEGTGNGVSSSAGGGGTGSDTGKG